MACFIQLYLILPAQFPSLTWTRQSVQSLNEFLQQQLLGDLGFHGLVTFLLVEDQGNLWFLLWRLAWD